MSGSAKSTSKSWARLTLVFPVRLQDEVLLALHEGGTVGTVIVEEGSDRTAPAKWTAYFETDTDLRPLLARLRARSKAIHAERGEVREEPWVQRQAAARRPIRIGNRFLVVPDAALSPRKNLIVLVVPSGRAFGTGEHETTRLCLEHLARLRVGGRTVLDVGTGSGILAMAAARTGARRVVGIDVDAEAIEVANANLALNGLAGEGGTVAFVAGGPGLLGGRFDIVLANLFPSALETEAARIARLQSEGGTLVISGFSPDEAGPLAARFEEAGYARRGGAERGEWASLVMRKVCMAGRSRARSSGKRAARARQPGPKRKPARAGGRGARSVGASAGAAPRDCGPHTARRSG